MRTLKQIIQGIGTGIALSLAVAGCGELERQACLSNNFHEAENAGLVSCEKKNQAPTLEIGVDFGDGLTGKVNYLLTAKDPDGKPIEYVFARFNGTGQIETYLNGSAVEKDIIPGTNSLEAYAVDDKGAQSQIVTRSFVSPTEAEARAVIDERLSTVPNNGITKDWQFNSGHFVDYAIERPILLNPDVIVEYISDQDNVNEKLNDKTYFDSQNPAVPNLYLARIPLSEIESRLNAWIDNGFQ